MLQKQTFVIDVCQHKWQFTGQKNTEFCAAYTLSFRGLCVTWMSCSGKFWVKRAEIAWRFLTIRCMYFKKSVGIMSAELHTFASCFGQLPTPDGVSAMIGKAGAISQQRLVGVWLHLGWRCSCGDSTWLVLKRDIAGVQKRKPYVYRRQGNRWDQYGESSSAASSEAHIASEQVNSESRWGPWLPSEPASRDKRPAQPYRLQKANKSDGQWTRWASDIRQSQLDQWSSCSSRWRSSAGDERSWNRVSEWEGSKWSTPTRGTLVGSEHDADQEWQLRSMIEIWRWMGLWFHLQPLQASKADTYRPRRW